MMNEAMTNGLTAEVAEDDAGERLDVLVARLTGTSRSAAARWLAEVDATLNGAPAKRSSTVQLGQRLVIPARPQPVLGEPPAMPPIRYQDEHLLLLSKPAGLVVHAGAGHHGDTLVDAMLAAGVPLSTGTAPERPGIVHRLDRDTSGLLMVASDDVTQEGLIEQLRQRTVLRRYLALVRGVPPSETGIVDAPIARHPTDRQRFACVEGGRPARTHWRVMETLVLDEERFSLVECRLETGRTHQIRVHLQAIGNPVVGDDRYGTSPASDAALSVPRLALHARTLGFEHPITGARVEKTEPVPTDLDDLFNRVGLTER
jgi:23S rRNA pseudouridine1911/1915/1917 synthase